MSDALERYEEQLLRLYAQVGTVDPSSPGFQALLAECALCAARIEREAQSLATAPGEERARARVQLQRSTALNALVQDAVRRERESVRELIGQAAHARASLARAAQSDASGDSCDVRG